MALGGGVVWARRSAGLECCTEAARLVSRPRISAFERWLALPASALAQPFKSDSRRTDLALGSPERRVRVRPARGFA